MLLLGSIDADNYGNFASDFVTQFMPVSRLDTTLTSASAIDSVKLKLMYAPGNFVGDSIMPMGLEVYRLNKGLKAPIFSDFDPQDYYDPSNPIGSTVYATSNLELSDSLKKARPPRHICRPATGSRHRALQPLSVRPRRI